MVFQYAVVLRVPCVEYAFFGENESSDKTDSSFKFCYSGKTSRREYDLSHLFVNVLSRLKEKILAATLQNS